MEKLHEDILNWFAEGADFDKGIMLFGQSTRNHYYVNNVAQSRRESTLQYELGLVLIKAGVVKRQPVVTPSPIYPLGPVDHSPLIKGEKKPEEKTGGQIKESPVPPVGGPPPLDKGGRITEQEEKVVMRDKFPFLNEPDCPDELKILVADSITSHRNYVEGHEKLFSVAHKDGKACYEVASETVEQYLNNRKIWKELDYYKEHKKILGEHPMFEKIRKERELYSMGLKDLKNKRYNLSRQIQYRRDKLKKKGADKEVLNGEIEAINKELILVEQLIEKRES